VVYQQFFVGHPRQDIKQCPCGMIYADSGLTQADYDTMYRERSKYAQIGSESIPDDRKRLAHTVSWLSAFIKAEENPSILDFGCATGDLLTEFKAHGFGHLFGYDASPACQDSIRARGFVPVTPNGQKFDCVVLSHVLEHIYDVQMGFREIVNLVEPHGVLYVEVPDASRYSSVSPFQDFNTEHVNHFTMASLCALAGRFGLVPLHIGEKTFEVGDGITYHAIFAIFRKTPAADFHAYIKASDIRMKAIEIRLTAALKDAKDVIVWGAGQISLKLLRLACLRDREVTLIDSNQTIQGQIIAGVPVLGPDDAKRLPMQPIVIGSILNSKSIAESVSRLKLPNRVIFLTATSE
jgi:SAM-dependent methyltransferase